MNPNVEEVFQQVFHGRVNPLTPKVVRYGTAGRYYFELSEGVGWGFGPGRVSGRLFTVTALEDSLNGPELRHRKSATYHSIEEAEEFLRWLESDPE